jgi:hypothetical protein
MKGIQLIRNISLGIVLFFVAVSCTERFDIILDDSFTRLVVDGFITTDSTTHSVRLTTTSSYFSNQEPHAVSEAIVYLHDESGSIQLIENSFGSGIYNTPDNFYGKPGSTYTLEINLKEAIGDSDYYTAQAYMPTTDFRLTGIELDLNERFGRWVVKLYAYDPPSLDFYKFDIIRNGVLLTDTAYRATMIDDRLFNGNETNGMGVLLLYKDEVLPGDTLTFIMSAIAEDYFNFLSELRNESGEFSNPLFSGPPANIRSNVHEGGLGYFAARKSKKIQFVVPEYVVISK